MWTEMEEAGHAGASEAQAEQLDNDHRAGHHDAPHPQCWDCQNG